MSTRLDTVVTSGIWQRLLGAACTEMMKHHSTRDLVDTLGIWAWDSDHRGLDWLVPEPLHAAAPCMDARDRARPIAGADKIVTLSASLGAALGPPDGVRPLLALGTLTSESTFAKLLEILNGVGRPVVLLAIADFPQDASKVSSFAKREAEARALLKRQVAASSKLAPVLLSRGALCKDGEIMDDTSKQLFMSCIQHILWLLLSYDAPENILTAWHRVIREQPAADWTLGHVQFDCGRPKGTPDPVRGHTWLGGNNPWEWAPYPPSICLTNWNHLGFRGDTGQTKNMAGHVFRDSGASPVVQIPGVDPVDHGTWLVDRIDVVLLNKVSRGQSVPAGAGDSSLA